MRKMKDLLRKILPEWLKIGTRPIRIKIRELREYPTIKMQPYRHKKALEKVREKSKNEKVTVAFFAIFSSVWKYEGVYKLMKDDPRFDPIVVVCPVVNYGEENMLLEMEKAYNYFKDKGYNVIRTYNESDKTYLDVKKEINPDIIFYTNPYKGLIDDRYYITKFKDTLTCYVRYFFQSISADEHGGDFIFHNRLWKFFCETDYHLKKVLNNYPANPERYIYTGYPGIEGLLYNDDKIINTKKRDELKKIIWAPHHTIDPKGTLYLSNFLEYYQFMIELAKKYENEVEFIFKPHPLLKVKLYNQIKWGKEKADNYYRLWEQMPNTRLEIDDYKKSFNISDAMIFDCNSFVSEYLYTGKPALFLFKNEKVIDIFNEFGRKAIENNYHGYSKSDIITFIEKNVLDGKDYKKEYRNRFYLENLIPPNNKTASENIINEIYKAIWG